MAEQTLVSACQCGTRALPFTFFLSLLHAMLCDWRSEFQQSQALSYDLPSSIPCPSMGCPGTLTNVCCPNMRVVWQLPGQTATCKFYIPVCRKNTHTLLHSPHHRRMDMYVTEVPTKKKRRTIAILKTIATLFPRPAFFREKKKRKKAIQVMNRRQW
ncbi:hypothetical protein VTO42DRAFT_5028 [Malbranchea cinnamomea]